MQRFFLLVFAVLAAFVLGGCVPPRSGYRGAHRIEIATKVTVTPSSAFAMPLKGTVRVLSKFGTRGRRPHTGVDLRSGKGKGAGEPVLASRAGRVMSVGWVRGYGKQAMIEHADGYRTRYAHMRSVSVDLGERVEQGRQIGRVGATGRASAPHLHFEVITPDGKFIDPLLLLPPGSLQQK
jgi:murein DD-endopeptidase MepM/ murein hydrolase activator NlpD